MDIYGHFTDISQGWSIDEGNDICVLYQRMGRGVGVNEHGFDSVGPEHDVKGVE